jgi:predicted translin family RNA/ssDNA-binding protein
MDKLRGEYKKSEIQRRQIISLSNIVINTSKKIIFALHRKEIKLAEEQFVEVEKILKKLEKEFGLKRINEEGSYSAAVEEYTEAKMFYFFNIGKKIDKIKEANLESDAYLGGICDFTGELVRRATNEASNGNYDEVKRIKEIIREVMDQLITYDLGGYLRTKYDQAYNNLRKIEQMDYEIALRKR